MTSKCVHCGADSDTPACFGCGNYFGDLVAALPGLLAELEVTTTRQHRAGGGHQRAGGETPLPYHPVASDTAAALVALVARWAVRLAQNQGLALVAPSVPRPGVWTGKTVVPGRPWQTWATTPVRFLVTHQAAIRRFPSFLTMLRELEAAMAEGHQVIDRTPDRVYAGQCGWTVDGQECTHTLYVDPTWAYTDCPRCGNRSLTNDRLWMVEEAMDSELTAVEISRAIPTWQGRPVTAAMVRGYANRGFITAIGLRVIGPTRSSPTYLLRDVRDHLLAQLDSDDVAPLPGQTLLSSVSTVLGP